MAQRREYKVTTANGDVHVFPSLEKRSYFIAENQHLFETLPLVKIQEDSIDPDHYKNRKYEVFDVMKDTQSQERHIGYLEGCVIKYMMRWDKKHDDPLQDLKKAKRYLEQLIQTIEEEQQHVMVSN